MPEHQQNKKVQRLKPHRLGALVVVAMALYSSAGSATEIEQSMFSFSGFGTVGVTHSSEKNADFVNSFFQPNGAGMSRSWSTDLDSRIGGQVSANFNNQLSAVVQIIAEQQWDNSYTPIVEWANVKYAITPDFSVRVGRIALPTFLTSDSRKVGYTMPWVRPPLEVYQQLPVTKNDGVDATYRFRIGNVSNSITGLAGKLNIMIPDGTPSGVFMKSKAMNIVDVIEYGALTLQAAYLHAKLTIPKVMDIPVPELSQVGDNAPFELMQAGVSYDPGNWFIMGECAKSRFELTGNKFNWYVSSGWRLGKFTPYVTYAKLKQITDPSPIPIALPAGQKSASIGLRWDAMKDISVKLQYDRINLDENSVGSLIPGPSFQPGGKLNVVSAVVDFVF